MRMHRAHLRCGPYNNVFFVVCCIVPVLTHLAPHPYLCRGSSPLLLKKKRSIGPRFFIFPSPHFGSYCLFGNPKSPGIELIYRDGYLWKTITRPVMLDFYYQAAPPLLSFSPSLSPFSLFPTFFNFSLGICLIKLICISSNLYSSTNYLSTNKRKYIRYYECEILK